MPKNLLIVIECAEKQCRGYLRAEQFNHLKSTNKCYAFSLSLSGTASALGTLRASYHLTKNKMTPIKPI